MLESMTELRGKAQSKREVAEMVRRIGPTMSVERYRERMRQHAEELEAEAAGLEAQAEALERSRSS